MIYYFIGESTSGKTTLGNKLHKFLKTEIRNWKQTVFHIDEDEIRELYEITDYSKVGTRKLIKQTQRLVELLHNNGCDVVVSSVTPFLDVREEFKDQFGSDIVEIYLHSMSNDNSKPNATINFETPESNFIDIDTTKHSPDKSFSKLINNLRKINKL